MERAAGCVNLKQFATKPTYTLQLQTEAYRYAKSEAKVLQRSTYRG
jgi:hypothetical protein